MIRFAVDEDVNNDIVRGLLRILPQLDIVRLVDAGLMGAPDSVGLHWAASEGRVMLTHDSSSMEKYSWDRVGEDFPMPGTIILHKDAQMGTLIQQLTEICESGESLARQVIHLPRR